MKRILYVIFATLLISACSNEELGEYYPDISTRELHYISRSGNIVEFNDDSFDAPIISNTYENGKGVVRFASSLRSIGLLGDIDITSITIPRTVKTFDGNPFKYCSNLARFISTYATSDGYGLVCDNEFIALARNYRGEKYEIPYGVKSIGENAFYGAAIKSVSIPNSVAKIGDAAFSGCKQLETLELPDRLEELGREVCVDCIALKSVKLPRNCSISEDFAGFVGCYNLESFSGENTSADGRCFVVNKRLYAFAPANLSEYTIPQGVNALADRSFAKCDRVLKITIPSSVVSLGSGVFYNCSSLSALYLEPNTPPTIKRGVGGIDPFENLPLDYTLYVPTSSYSKYSSDSDWSRYLEHMKKYN